MIDQLIKRAAKSGELADRRKVVQVLRKATLYIAVRDEPHLSVDTNGCLTKDVPVSMLKAHAPDGSGAVLLIFTSVKHLKRRNASAKYIATNFSGVLKALALDTVGILINPAGPWIYFPREELECM